MECKLVEDLEHTLQLKRFVKNPLLILLLFAPKLCEVFWLHPDSFNVANTHGPGLDISGNSAISIFEADNVAGFEPADEFRNPWIFAMAVNFDSTC